MANAKTLRQLIKAGSRGDRAAFRQASESVIRQERAKQHHLLANDLENILYADQMPRVSGKARSAMPEPPVDKERGLPLVDIRQPGRSLEEIVLPPNSLQPIEELLEEHRRADILQSYGMQPSSRALLYGPPGCGKTLAAEVIAFELDLPLAIVRLDALVSSFLGETAANLRKIFDFISSTRVVALFDEFDALGKKRTDSGEHGELRRVVNAVLQMMDAYKGNSLILAATNHETILDQAIWRRFDELIAIPLPEEEQLQKILTLKLRGVRRQFDVQSRDVMRLFRGKSGADIERIVRRAIKRMILRGDEFMRIMDLRQAKAREEIIGHG